MPHSKTLIDIVMIYSGGRGTGLEGARFLHDGRYEQDTNIGKNAPNAQEGSQYLQKPRHLLSTYFQPFAKRDQKRHTPACKLFTSREAILSMGCILSSCLIKHF